MNRLLVLVDTIQQYPTSAGYSCRELLSSACEIATVVIALVNVILLVLIFNKGTKADIEKEERNRKLNLFKTLVLDQNMALFYKFFDDFTTECDRLSNANDIFIKKEIDINLQKKTRLFRQRFICLLSAIDEQLYKEILSATDNLSDSITEAIFNEGINLDHRPMFDEKISKPVHNCKINMIKILFHYQGK